MSPLPRRFLTLREYEEVSLSRAEITEEEGELIHRKYGRYLSVTFPSPLTRQRWTLTSQGYVGLLPVTDELTLELAPRFAMRSVFALLEHAYNIKSLQFLSGTTGAVKVNEVYDILARLLATRTIERVRRGLHRDYVEETDTLSMVRGRINLAQTMASLDASRAHCTFEEHTLDNLENQIVAAGLERILRSRYAKEETLQLVRQAYGAFRGLSTPDQTVLLTRSPRYNRLNKDYEDLHALSRFFLENTGPSHESGSQRTVPFVLNMPRLYERFVAMWLQQHVPATFDVRSKERLEVDPDGDGELVLELDILIVDARTGIPTWVLDTKYKPSETILPADFNQLVSYSVGVRCAQAALIYPEPRTRPFDKTHGTVRIKAASFAIDADLDTAGRALLTELGIAHGVPAAN